MSLLVSIQTVFFVCILSNISCVQKNFSLEYNLKDNAKFTILFSENEHYSREIMGNEIVTNSTDKIEYQFRVKSEKSDGFDLEMEYGLRSHETDNAQYGDGIDFSELIGKKANFFLSSNGELSEFEGFDNYPTIEIPDQQYTLKKSTYINELKRLFPSLPGKSVDTGETWINTLKYSEQLTAGDVEISIKSTYTLLEETTKDGIECVKIDTENRITVHGEVKEEGMNILIDMQGSGNDTIYFDHKKGMFLSVEGAYNLTGKGIIEELEMEIPMDHQYKKKIEVRFD